MKFLSKLDPKRMAGKVVLVRIDLNVEGGAPLDTHRVAAVIPTLKLLARQAAGVVILSHRGRPKLAGKRGTDWHLDSECSLRPFAPLLARKIGKPVAFVPGMAVLASDLPGTVRSRGGVWLLENLRAFAGEEQDDRRFAATLAKLGDMYVNEAFAVSHRAHASVHALAKLRPAYAGLRFEEELVALRPALGRLKRPTTLIIGGAKIGDKIGMVSRFGSSADHILLAGGPANTFFAASRLTIGDSVSDDASLPFARKNLKNSKIVLPIDTKVHGRRILDVGERTMAVFTAIVEKSQTIIWNGPLGLFEERRYAHGTMELWRALARNRTAMIIVGGGETVASLALLPDLVLPKNIFVSTGGGAMLEYLAGKKLPGVQALG